MQNKIFLLIILFFCGFSQMSDAQIDTIKASKNNTTTKEVDKAQQIEAELLKLKEEVQQLKQNKKDEPVVIVQSAKTISANKSAQRRYTVVNMNMTTMISRLVPFGNGIPISGPTSLMLRRYRDNRAFRMGIGLNASNDAESINSFLRLGTERKRELNDKLTFVRGVDFLLGVGTFNTPGFRFSGDGVTIGADLSLGIEYRINKYISFSTETLIFGGVAANDFDSGFTAKIIPPIALYLNVKIN
jgi:hypothetical protein